MNHTPLTQRHWYLLTSKPHKDALAEEHLRRQGYHIYRPLAQRLRKRGGKIQTVTESLFPRYIFIHLDQLNDNWRPIRSTLGVQGFVRFGVEPAQVPHRLITDIQSQAESLGAKAIDLDRFHKGDTVMLKDGPYQGLRGIFLSYNGEERAMILMDILHCKASLEVDTVKLIAA